jgi:hypothetical protein
MGTDFVQDMVVAAALCNIAKRVWRAELARVRSKRIADLQKKPSESEEGITALNRECHTKFVVLRRQLNGPSPGLADAVGVETERFETVRGVAGAAYVHIAHLRDESDAERSASMQQTEAMSREVTDEAR